MDLNLQKYSSFKVGGLAYRILNLRSETDIISAVSYAQKCEKSFIIIGEGTNSIFSDEPEKFIIGHMEMKGIFIKKEDDDFLTLRISAGEIWDDVVKWSTSKNLSGIETLSGIPGTAGAAPIQNIGAYGTELSDVLTNVKVYNIETKRFKSFTNDECEFGYRDSFFKKNKFQYIISEITIKLSKSLPKVPDYNSIKDSFTTSTPTSDQIRNVVLNTRAQKLPDYKMIPNCGSFFKNPIVSKDTFLKIQENNFDIVSFETNTGDIKLFAGWLIEHIDYKSIASKNIECYEKNKLILINTGNASFEELKNVVQQIIQNVKNTFGITLEVEPNLFE